MSAFQHIRLEDCGSSHDVLWIDMQGRKLNVVEEEFFRELVRVADILLHRTNHKPLVVRSAKDKAFVVGADLRRILQIHSDIEIQSFLKQGQEALDIWEGLPFATIAWIDGACLGGGLEFALACRYRVASDSVDSMLGMPETKLGLTPGWGGTQRLIPRVGLEFGLQMLCGGESIASDVALKVGLIDGVWHKSDETADLKRWLQRAKESDHERKQVHSREDLRIAWNKAAELRKSFLHVNRADEMGLVLPARETILKDVALGLNGTREDGLRGERENFYALLERAEVQAVLQKFAKPKNTSS